MPDSEEDPTSVPRPPIAWSGGAAPFAFVPGRALVRGDAAAEYFDAITDRRNERTVIGGPDDSPEAAWMILEDVDESLPADESLSAVRRARADGFDVQPDHVFFAHGCDECGCGPHPSLTFDACPADHYGANPHRANPHRANPHRANPHRANPQTSSAIPAMRRAFPPRELSGSGPHPRITILDTGIAVGPQLPALLGGSASNRISGDPDRPDSKLVDTSGTNFSQDSWLDPVAGHGTFIAGLIEQLAPGCELRVEHVISGLGDAIESDVYGAVSTIADLDPGRRPHILSLSFGGNALAEAPALRSAIAKAQQRGIVIVASAGNDGTCRRQFPAAYAGVVAVGALGQDGPTPWTNFGGWVDACAPGADLVSAFFADFNGPEPLVNTFDPDHFEGWAIWSGTSFAAPVVVSALAREMVVGGCSATVAVDRLLRGPAALRIRSLGTVVAA